MTPTGGSRITRQRRKYIDILSAARMVSTAQKAVRSRLERMIGGGTLPPSLLFTGPEGSGKELLAVELAAMLNCGESTGACDPRCPSCGKVATLEHPDLRLVFPVPYGEAEKGTRVLLESRRGDFFGSGEFGNRARSIGIDLIRGIIEAVSKHPYEGRHTVVILNEAHLATAEAQNAFLKLLEEPPTSSVLVLVTRFPDRLLPTVLSRCQELRAEPLSAGAIAEFLVKYYSVEKKEAQRTAELAGGNLRRGIRLLDERFLQIRSDAATLIGLAYAAKGRELLVESEAIARGYTRDEVEQLLGEAVLVIRSLMRGDGSQDGQKALSDMFGARTVRTAGERDLPADLRKIQQSSRNLRRHVDVELTLSHLLLDLAGKWY